MINALNKYAAGRGPPHRPGGKRRVRLGVRLLFTAAAKAANLGNNATPAQVISGLYALHDEIWVAWRRR